MKADPESKRSRRRKHRVKMKASKARCIVYAIEDAAGCVRYVGQTRLLPEDRMAYHLKAASPSGSPIQRWLNENVGSIRVLDDRAIWDVSEIVWIERMKARGEPLLNCNMGGRDTGR